MLLLLILMSASFLNGSVGCKNTCGFKVECQCPCKFILDYRGRCAKCGHSGELDRGQATSRVVGISENQFLNHLYKVKSNN